MDIWIILATIVLLFIAVDLAAMLWGTDSRYDGNHKEWERHHA